MRDSVRAAIAALTFLTAFPVGRRAAIAAPDLRRGVALFPVVGALIGASMALTAWASAHVLPSFPAAVLGVAVGMGVTAAMHLDGLADTADGLGARLAGRDLADAIADPRLGTFGAAALGLDLLLKVSVLAALVAAGGFPWEVAAAAALGRGSVLALGLAVPYSGPSNGAGAWTTSTARRHHVAGLIVCIAIGFLTVGARYAAMLPVSVLVCLAVGRWSARHLGGMRGDTFGAATELTETLALAAAVAAS